MFIVSYLEMHTTALMITTGLFGLIFGSFINVVIHRLPIMLKTLWHTNSLDYLGQQPKPPIEQPNRFNLKTPRSHCPKCKKNIRWWHNIPLLSFIVLRGHCYYCHAKISWRYPVVELLTALLSAFLAWYFFATWELILALLFTWSLLALTFIDIEHHILPDHLTLPMLWIGLFVNIFGMFTATQDAIIGAMLGYLSLWFVAWIYRSLTHRDGVGQGDFKLLAAMGAWLGWQALPVVVIIAAISGIVIGGGMLLVKKQSRLTPIPFGPFLALSGWIALVWGNNILAWYYSISGSF